MEDRAKIEACFNENVKIGLEMIRKKVEMEFKKIKDI